MSEKFEKYKWWKYGFSFREFCVCIIRSRRARRREHRRERLVGRFASGKVRDKKAESAWLAEIVRNQIPETELPNGAKIRVVRSEDAMCFHVFWDGHDDFVGDEVTFFKVVPALFWRAEDIADVLERQIWTPLIWVKEYLEMKGANK